MLIPYIYIKYIPFIKNRHQSPHQGARSARRARHLGGEAQARQRLAEALRDQAEGLGPDHETTGKSEVNGILMGFQWRFLMGFPWRLMGSSWNLHGIEWDQHGDFGLGILRLGFMGCGIQMVISDWDFNGCSLDLLEI